MSTSTPSGSSSLGKRAIAVLVLAIVAWLLFKVVIGIVASIATILVVILAVAAVIWAIRTL